MSREYNYGGTSLIVDSIDEIFESGAVSTKTVNNIKQIIGQQRQTKDINKLKEQIGGAAEDGTISASEKPGLSREWASLVSSYSSIADKFKNYNLTDNTLFYLLQRKYEELSPIMGEILANMDTSYTDKEKVSKITDLFVGCWEDITKCLKYIEDKMSISDRFALQVSANREIVTSLELKATLLFYDKGSYTDVTYTEAYPDEDFIWRKSSDSSFERTGKILYLTLADMSSEEETFSITFRHVGHYEDPNHTELIIERSINFSVYTGTLSQWAWSDAESKEELLADAFKVWTASRTESNGKKYLWRRDTEDLLKLDSEKEWIYVRESGLDGLVGSNGYSRAVLELFKRSADEPSTFDGGKITYTFSTNAISGNLGSWSRTIPNGDNPLYIIKATAFANTDTDDISVGEWTPPVILSEHGTDGSAGPTAFSIILYQRAESEPSKPTEQVSYNIKTNAITGAGNWKKDMPNDNGLPCWTTSATAFTYTDVDTIEPSEWADVAKLVESGKDGKDGESAISQYRLSDSNSEPPTDTIVFSVNGSATLFDGTLLVNAVDGWVDEMPSPTAEHPFIWQRVSKDNGLTWGTPICINPVTINEYLDVWSTPPFYTFNSRGVSDEAQHVDITIDRTYIPSDYKCYIQIYHFENDESIYSSGWFEHNASSTYRIEIPAHITYDRIVVEVSCGNQNRAISINAVKDGKLKGEKQLGVAYLYNNELYKDAEHTLKIEYLNDNQSMPFAEGDYALVNCDGDSIPYRYTAGVWTAITSDITTAQDYSNIMLDTLVDVLASGKDVQKSMKAHYAFIGQLAAQTATIEKIFSKHIRVLNEGSIYAGGFDEKGNNANNNAGFHLSADGNLQAVGATLKSVTVNGSVDCSDDNGDVLKTSYGKQGTSYACSPKERWSHADMCSSLSPGSVGTGSYDGANYGYQRTDSNNPHYIVNSRFGVGVTLSFTALIPMTVYYELPSYKQGFGYVATALHLNGSRIVYANDGVALTGSLSLNANDVVMVENIKGSSGGSDFIKVMLKDDAVVLYGDDNVPSKIIRNESKFDSASASIGAFASSSNIKYATADGWFAIKSGGVSNSPVTINGASYTVNAASNNGSTLIISTTNGSSFTFVKAQKNAIDSIGWYNIAGTLTEMAEERGVTVESLYPVKDGITQIGTDKKRFSGYFSGMNVSNAITAGGDITGNKVWRAVFN